MCQKKLIIVIGIYLYDFSNQSTKKCCYLLEIYLYLFVFLHVLEWQ